MDCPNRIPNRDDHNVDHRPHGASVIGVPDGVQADAEWFAKHGTEYWKVLYRLRTFCADNGPVDLPDGRRVGLFADGADWNVDAVAEIAPGLVSRMAVTFDGTVPEVERALSLVTEELPALEFSIKRTLDKPALTGMLRSGSETAERLKACRTDRAKLQVKSA